jgi:hypothetical protein
VLEEEEQTRRLLRAESAAAERLKKDPFYSSLFE